MRKGFAEMVCRLRSRPAARPALVQVAEVGRRGGLGRAHRTGGAGHRAGHGAGRGGGGQRLLREDGVRVVDEVLEELLVLGAELLAGLLEAVDLVELVLLLGQGLADDLDEKQNDLDKMDGVIRKSIGKGLKVSAFTSTRQRKFISGEVALNNRISKIIHDEGEPGVRLGDYVFFAGDPVIFRRNNYDKGYTNGQPGTVVIAGRSEKKKYMLIKSEGREIELSGAETYDVMPGYCMTAHKSQGGECDNALIVLTKECPAMLMRQLLYVEVTRAKKGVLIISEGDALEQAIKNDRRAERTTGLMPLLVA